MESGKDDIDKESLLTEYKIAHEKHNYFGKILWQIATIFLTASLAGFAFGVQQDLPLLKLIFLNSFLSILLLVFFFQARRLSRLSFLHLLRCKEIEKILPMKIATNQLEEAKNGIEILDHKMKRQRITGRILNQGTPLILLAIFWGYIIGKHFGLIE